MWEGFILLAVAAKDEPGTKRAVEKVPVIKVTESTSENMTESESGPGNEVQSSETVVSMDTSSVTTSAAVPSDQHQGDGMETSESDTANTRSETPEPTSKLPTDSGDIKPSNNFIQSLKQLPPLFTITSQVGRSLAELLSFLVKVSTSPLHRPNRRGAGFLIPHYQPPSDEAISVCSEVTDLLLDSLKWEVPMPEQCPPAMQSPIRDWLFGG